MQTAKPRAQSAQNTTTPQTNPPIGSTSPNHNLTRLESLRTRARGCLLGQLAGDSLGSLVEFKSAERIRELYPQGVAHLAHGGTWNTLAGQPTDDSEMALTLARSLVKHQAFKLGAIHQSYKDWAMSKPFDIGHTTSSGLAGSPVPQSQANGSLMRISPLGIFGWQHPLDALATWARQDAALTHPNPVCLDTTCLFTLAIAHVVNTGCNAETLYAQMLDWAHDLKVEKTVINTLIMAADQRPKDFQTQQGWVLIAFQNAVWQMLHAESAENGIIDTVMQGGDTDTNAAISGALLGALHGEQSIPNRWTQAILQCRPSHENPNAKRVRPPHYWPTDALDLADALVCIALKG